MYAVSHSDYWNRNESNYGQWFIYKVNPNAGAYDSPGKPVAWMEKSNWTGGSAEHLKHNDRMENLARVMCEALNKAGV
jgi:hypothetical protein